MVHFGPKFLGDIDGSYIGDIVDLRNVVQFRQHKLSTFNTRRVSKPALNMTVLFQIVHIFVTSLSTKDSSKHSITVVLSKI